MNNFSRCLIKLGLVPQPLVRVGPGMVQDHFTYHDSRVHSHLNRLDQPFFLSSSFKMIFFLSVWKPHIFKNFSIFIAYLEIEKI